jgi:putative glutamine amidotransferase
MHPIIGITPSYDHERQRYALSPEYTGAVREAGGIPLIVPYLDAEATACVLKVCKGILLSGGVDLDPVHFGEEPLPQLGRICPERDRAELILARQALAAGVPLFGICRGIQLLNVAAGGTLVQDIGTGVQGRVKHSQTAPRFYPTHTVEIENGSVVASLLGTTSLRVNSFHHQSVKSVAPGFRVTARAADGVIEAIEGPGFAVGVQWHPECMWKEDRTFLRLFEGLVDAARGAR